MTGEEGFLGRWSRRKRAASRGEEEPPPSAVVPGIALPAGIPATERAACPQGGAPATPVAEGPPPPTLAADAPSPPVAEQPFDPASLPPVESLTAESDLAPFLRPQVPPALRHAALRRMWALDPAVRDYVTLADYAYDYNVADGAPGFALSLGGDAAKLLARAIGLGDSPGAISAAREPGTPEPAVLQPGTAATDEPASAPAPLAADGGLPPPAGGTEAQCPAPIATASAEPATPEPAARPPARRHGGARPA